jgi:hypothetical protein
MQKSFFVAALAVLALAACEKRLDTSSAVAPVKLAAAGSAGNLVGTAPGPATKVRDNNPTDGSPLSETPNTVSYAEQEKELSKAEERTSMPLPGQPNDHSNVASDASQKAGQNDPQQSQPRNPEPNPPSPQRDNPPRQ